MFTATSSEVTLADYSYTGSIIASLTHETVLDTAGCELEYTCSDNSFAAICDNGELNGSEWQLSVNDWPTLPTLTSYLPGA